MKTLVKLAIPKTSGNKIIASSRELFDYISPDFLDYRTCEERPQTVLEVQEMVRDADFEQMMSKEDVLTQEQILYFVENHKDLLGTDGSTFFPFRDGEDGFNPYDNLFVAGVHLSAKGKLSVELYKLCYDYEWIVEDQHRVVIAKNDHI